VQRLPVAALVALVLAGTGSAAPVRDPLRGTWDSGQISVARIRTALEAAGYSDIEIEKYRQATGQGSITSLEFHFKFYRPNGRPVVVMYGFDPGQSWTLRWQPRRYKLLSNHRVEMTSVDAAVRSRYVFSYRVTGQTLVLRVITSTDPRFSKERVRFERQGLYEVTAAPFKKAR
jgi:hypothetical protein